LSAVIRAEVSSSSPHVVPEGGHEHGCQLQEVREVALAAALGEKSALVPAPEPLAALDRCTYRALAAGRVTLPGREVHAGVWFRLLRSLLDEVILF